MKTFLFSLALNALLAFLIVFLLISKKVPVAEMPVLPPVEELYPSLAAHALECEQCGDRVYRDKIVVLCEEGDRLFKKDFAERWKKIKEEER